MHYNKGEPSESREAKIDFAPNLVFRHFFLSYVILQGCYWCS